MNDSFEGVDLRSFIGLELIEERNGKEGSAMIIGQLLDLFHSIRRDERVRNKVSLKKSL